MKHSIGDNIRLLKRQRYADRTFKAGTIAQVLKVRGNANAYVVRFQADRRPRHISAQNVAKPTFSTRSGTVKLLEVFGVDTRTMYTAFAGDSNTDNPPPPPPARENTSAGQ